MKLFLLLIFFIPFLSFSQTRMTFEKKIDLTFSFLCNYDYDLERCIDDIEAPTEVIVSLSEGGGGRLIMFVNDKVSFRVKNAWSYSDHYYFEAYNNQNVPFDGYIYFDKNRYATQFTFRAKGAHEGLIFH